LKKVELFSDGSCLNNPGTGGWAYILKCEGSVKKDCGAQADTTNNKMEITAALNGLKALNQKCEVELFTDSQYVQKGINEWLEGWAKKNYSGVKNPDLWREMKAMCETHKVRAHWVKGHAGHPENEECDEAAREAATRLEGQIKGKTVSNLNIGAELCEEDKKLFKFESLLGYEFKDKALLREALTHKSFKANFSNERLEFLGDAVLDLIVGEYLYHKIKGANNEGNLSKLRAALVNEDSFAKIAARIGLGGFIFMSGAEERNGGREKSLRGSVQIDRRIAVDDRRSGSRADKLPARQQSAVAGKGRRSARGQSPDVERTVADGDGRPAQARSALQHRRAGEQSRRRNEHSRSERKQDLPGAGSS
jgi:ribonuclease HI